MSVYDKLSLLCEIYNNSLNKFLSINENERVFHYTSLSVLESIVGNEKLRFANRNYQNDKSEGKYILKLCKEYSPKIHFPKKYKSYFNELCERYYSDLPKANIHTYICCFSTNGDNLALWNYYVKDDSGKGCNLLFSSKRLKEKLRTTGSNEEQMKEEQRLKVFGRKVIYNVVNQKKIIREVERNFVQLIIGNIDNDYFCKKVVEELIYCLICIGVFFKHPAFKCEEEYRLAIFPTKNVDNNTFHVINKSSVVNNSSGHKEEYFDINFPIVEINEIKKSPILTDKYRDEIEKKLNNKIKIRITDSIIPVRY